MSGCSRRAMGAWNMPRPCVTATSLPTPRMISSSTATFAGPSLVDDHVAPKSSDANTPTSVPTYSHPPQKRAIELTGALGSDLGVPGTPGPVIFVQDAPPVVVRHRL